MASGVSRRRRKCMRQARLGRARRRERSSAVSHEGTKSRKGHSRWGARHSIPATSPFVSFVPSCETALRQPVPSARPKARKHKGPQARPCAGGSRHVRRLVEPGVHNVRGTGLLSPPDTTTTRTTSCPTHNRSAPHGYVRVWCRHVVRVQQGVQPTRGTSVSSTASPHHHPHPHSSTLPHSRASPPHHHSALFSCPNPPVTNAPLGARTITYCDNSIITRWRGVRRSPRRRRPSPTSPPRAAPPDAGEARAPLSPCARRSPTGAATTRAPIPTRSGRGSRAR